MDGGIGEAALMGAVIGGGSAALTGGDPLKGALMGGATSGIMGAMGGMNGVDPFTMGQTGTDAFTANAFDSTVSPDLVASQREATRSLFDIPQTSTPIPGAVSPSIQAAPETLQAFENTAVNTANPQLHGLDIVKANPWKYGMIGAAQALPGLLQPKGLGNVAGTEKYDGPLSKFKYSPDKYTPAANPNPNVYQPVYTDYTVNAADGGLMGGNGIAGLSANPTFPMADQQTSRYAVPSQMPVGANDVRMAHMAPTSMARGGIADLGGYSDGGRMLKGPGDGMSDSIPASISGKQPARLADGEFVVPADVVSHLGNGSTDAGAKQLYKMMDKVRTARTGRKAQGKQINPKKYMPA